MASTKTYDEIKEQLDVAEGMEDYPGMTYQEGVVMTLLWVLGYEETAPYTIEEE